MTRYLYFVQPDLKRNVNIFSEILQIDGIMTSVKLLNSIRRVYNIDILV